MPKKISDADTNLLIGLWQAKTSVQDIAKQLHVTRSTVYARLRNLQKEERIVDQSPQSRRQHRASSRRVAALENLPELWSSVLTTKEVAEKIKYSVPQTFALARLLKLPSRHRHHQKPLDEHRQAAIIVLRECGWVFEDIAAILSISRQRAHQLWTKAQKKKS